MLCYFSFFMGQYLSTKGDWRSGSAGALQAQGRGFKSLIAHHRIKKAAIGSFFYATHSQGESSSIGLWDKRASLVSYTKRMPSRSAPVCKIAPSVCCPSCEHACAFPPKDHPLPKAFPPSCPLGLLCPHRKIGL